MATTAPIRRFGWKAQNKSLLIFSGEAYNVEMGITNELFPHRAGDEDEVCNPAHAAQRRDSTLDGIAPGVLSSIDLFTLFMRFLAPPTPSGHVARRCRVDHPRPRRCSRAPGARCATRPR